MKPYIHSWASGTGNSILWNIGSSVGKGAANNSPCDIFYLQWYYTLSAQAGITPEERKVIYRKVQMTGHCRGTDNDPLVAAISAQQEAMAHPRIDGRINVAHGAGKIDGKAFHILRLGARLATLYPNLWPRLDLMPGCPALVAQAVRDVIPNMFHLSDTHAQG